MTRRYYIHGTYQLFRHVIIDIKGMFQLQPKYQTLLFLLYVDCNAQHHKYALVQYLFDGPEVEVKIKPHGNSNHARPYFRTSESTKQHLQEIVAMQKPKETINTLTMEKGGGCMQDVYPMTVGKLSIYMKRNVQKILILCTV